MAATQAIERPVLVTGGAGHLGFVLTSELARSGYRVRATLRPSRPGEGAGERTRRERCAREHVEHPAYPRQPAGVLVGVIEHDLDRSMDHVLRLPCRRIRESNRP